MNIIFLSGVQRWGGGIVLGPCLLSAKWTKALPLDKWNGTIPNKQAELENVADHNFYFHFYLHSLVPFILRGSCEVKSKKKYTRKIFKMTDIEKLHTNYYKTTEWNLPQILCAVEFEYYFLLAKNHSLHMTVFFLGSTHVIFF